MIAAADTDIDLFAGPGGWDEAARALGVPLVGIELDASACATRRAAGHVTVRGDVSEVATEKLAGRIRGFIGSPPCTVFSAAGDGAGNAVTALLAVLIRDLFTGRDTRAECRRAIVAELTDSGWPGKPMPAKDRAAKIERAAASAVLVAEPARFIAAGHPEWIALEQVPAVLPLWQVYCLILGSSCSSTRRRRPRKRSRGGVTGGPGGRMSGSRRRDCTCSSSCPAGGSRGGPSRCPRRSRCRATSRPCSTWRRHEGCERAVAV